MFLSTLLQGWERHIKTWKPAPILPELFLPRCIQTALTFESQLTTSQHAGLYFFLAATSLADPRRLRCVRRAEHWGVMFDCVGQQVMQTCPYQNRLVFQLRHLVSPQLAYAIRHEAIVLTVVAP